MPITPEVFEGTWEELAGRASQFAGRRLRVTILPEAGSSSPTLQVRQTFLKLPLAERRRLLAEQAERIGSYYQHDGEWREWLQGDIVEY